MKKEEMLRIFRYSKEEMLADTLKRLINSNYKNIYATSNYVFAEGEIPIMLVAHCDTVHRVTPDIILFDEEQKLIWSPDGIGGDDRCGIIAIYEIIKKYKPYVLFTQDEEIGGLGADEFCKDFKNLSGIKFCIEIDRRGNNQAVFYDCGNEELQDYICNTHKFEKQYGTFTDVKIVGEELDIGIVNVSAGYYNEHSISEYVNLEHLENTIEKVKKILEENIDKYFDYQLIAKTYNINYYNNFKEYNEDYYEKDYMYQEEEDYEKLSEQEWLDLYGYTKPKDEDELWQKIVDAYFD